MQRTPNLDLAFRALGHSTRRLLVRALARAEALSADDLASQLPGDTRAIPRHLRVLVGAGLVMCFGDGVVSRYRLRRDVLDSMTEWLRRQDVLQVFTLELLDQRLSEAAKHDRGWELPEEYPQGRRGQR
jgi:DNA-binding transcriptional ArsR family regulator